MKYRQMDLFGLTIDEQSNLFQRAVKAYVKLCKKRRLPYDQPSFSSSQINSTFVRLNINTRTLATYKVTASGRVRLDGKEVLA
jgi:hypothetical protein